MSSIHYHKFPTDVWTVPGSHAVKRLKFSRDNALPLLSEVRQNLGPLLSDIFFQKLPPDIKDEIGVEPLLEGPKGSLWCSPSQQILGKLKLSPVEPRRKVEALTHSWIVELGEELEHKINILAQQRLEEAVAAKEEEILLKMKDFVEEAIKKFQKQLEEYNRLKFRTYKEELENTYKNMAFERDQEFNITLQNKLEESLRMMSESMQEELKTNAEQREAFALDCCKFTRMWDANLYNENFKRKINFYRKKWMLLLKNTVKTAEKNSEILKTKLNADLASSLQSVIFEEKKKSKDLFMKSREEDNKKIKNLKEEIKRLKEENESLKQVENINVESKDWYCLFTAFLLQFQKFINFVLTERSGYAEYFLSLENILRGKCPDVYADDYCASKDDKERPDYPTEVKKISGIIEKDKIFEAKVDDYYLGKIKICNADMPHVDADFAPAVEDVRPVEMVMSTLTQVDTKLMQLKDMMDERESIPKLPLVSQEYQSEENETGLSESHEWSPKWWHRKSEIERSLTEIEKLLSNLLRVLSPPINEQIPSNSAIFPEISEDFVRKVAKIEIPFTKIKVVGEEHSCQQIPVETFIPKRIHSLLKILKKYPKIKRIMEF